MSGDKTPLDDEGRALIENVGALFREVREEQALSQYDVAKNMGVSQSRVSALETGVRDIQVGTLNRWARAYGFQLEIALLPLEEERIGTDETGEVGK